MGLLDTLQSHLTKLDAAIGEILTEKMAETNFGGKQYTKLNIAELWTMRVELQAQINKLGGGEDAPDLECGERANIIFANLKDE